MKSRLSLLFLLAAMELHAGPPGTSPVKPLSDSYIKQQIVGTWTLEEAIKPTGSHKLVLTMAADGTSVSKSTLVSPVQTNEWNYAGKWEIKNGDCITTLTKSSAKIGKSDPVGTVERCKILNVDSNQLVQQVGTQVMSLKRKK